MTPRRSLFLLLLAAAMALGVELRLATREQLRAGPRVHALTSDDNYHLRRARFAVANYPRTIIFDPLMNFPEGGVAIWPPLFDVALATPSRLLHGAGAPTYAIEREAAWVPIFFAAGAILFAGLLGREIFGNIGGVAMALFLAVCPGHILWTQYGHTDQHVAESFFGLLVLWLFVRSRTREEERSCLSLGKRAGARGGLLAASGEAATGIALTLAVLAWQGAIYWGAIFALSLFLEAAGTRRSVFRPAMLILALPAALVASATALWLGNFRPPLTYISFGFFQPLFLAALAGSTVLLDTILTGLRGRLTRLESAARLAAIAVVAAAVLPSARGLLLGLVRGFSYAAGATSGEIAGSGGYLSYPKDWLKGIYEARPLLADGLGLAVKDLSFAFFLSPLAILLWALRARRGERPGVHIALAVWGAVTLLLSLSQRVNVYYAAPLAAATLVEAARLAAARAARMPMRRGFAAAAIGLALASPFAKSTPEELRTVYAASSDLYATLGRMGRELPHVVDPYDPRLLSPTEFPPELARAGSVLAPWSLGHRILYESGLPVVSNNFGYGFADSLRFFLSETEEEALAIARRRRARWVLATDLVPRMNDYASYLGRPPSLGVTEQGLVPTDRYFSTLQSRLYDFDGEGRTTPELTVPPLAHFRLRFHSASAIRRGERWLARWKVFEIVE